MSRKKTHLYRNDLIQISVFIFFLMSLHSCKIIIKAVVCKKKKNLFQNYNKLCNRIF